jgi:hypothetical protein
MSVDNIVTIVSLDPNDVELNLEVVETTIVVASEGLQGVAGPTGPAGPTGSQGPQGPQGTPGSAPQSYIFDQAVPASTWVITHNLGYPPNVTVVDSALTTIEGSITYDSNNQITLSFTTSFAGKAYLS